MINRNPVSTRAGQLHPSNSSSAATPSRSISSSRRSTSYPRSPPSAMRPSGSSRKGRRVYAVGTAPAAAVVPRPSTWTTSPVLGFEALLHRLGRRRRVRVRADDQQPLAPQVVARSRFSILGRDGHTLGPSPVASRGQRVRPCVTSRAPLPCGGSRPVAVGGGRGCKRSGGSLGARTRR